jgi:hypothetical protein
LFTSKRRYVAAAVAVRLVSAILGCISLLGRRPLDDELYQMLSLGVLWTNTSAWRVVFVLLCFMPWIVFPDL